MESDGRTTIKGEREMNYSRIILFGCSLLLWVGTIVSGPIVQAKEGTGGQVSTTGKISFYEEVTEPSSSAPVESSTAKPTKPIGNFPSTGEQIRTYSLILGGMILLFFLLLFLRKRRKEERE